jgi:hypothetical protein
VTGGRERTSEDIDGKKGQTDDVQLDERHVGTAFRTGKGEPEDAKVGGVVVGEDSVVENERLLHRDDVVCGMT